MAEAKHEFENPGYDQAPPAYGDQTTKAYGAQAYGAQAYGAQPYGTQPYGTQPYETQPYGGPQYGAPQYGAPPYGGQAFINAPVIVQQPSPQNVVLVSTVVRPRSYMVMSCLTFWFCNCLFGAIAFFFSLSSSGAADRGDMVTARAHGRTAMVLNTVGIVTSLVVFTILIILLAAGVYD